MTRPRALLAAGAVLVLLLGVAGWLALRESPAERPEHPAWPRSSEPVDPADPVVASAREVRLSDGTTIPTDQPIDRFVVAGDGVFYVPAGASADDPLALHLATPTGDETLDARPDPDSLHASLDGRYLGFVERGRPVAEAVVVDLSSGEEVARSSAGMGERGEDLEARYADNPPTVLAILDGHAYVATSDDIRGIDLSTGESEVLGQDDGDVWDQPWYVHVREHTGTQFPRRPD